MPVKSYSCFNCGAELKWNPITQSFKCEYCDSEFHDSDFKNADVEQAETKQKAEKPNHQTNVDNPEVEQNNFVVYSCAYCGAELVTNEDTAATFCLYCQRPVVLEANLKGEFKPDYVIPFVKTKDDAIAAFKNFIDGKIFVPDSFQNTDHIEKITGLYVPFWIVDTKLGFSTKRHGEIVKNYVQGNYNCTKVDTYELIRDGHIHLKGVPADASSKIDDKIMSAIEPYDWKELIDFKQAYLSGFLAERYDVPLEQCFEDVILKKVEASLENQLNNEATGFSNMRTTYLNKNLEGKEGKYALLPVWLLYSQFEGENYVFAMNGQTGRLRGNLPMDKKKIQKYGTKVFAGSFAVTTVIGLIFTLLGGGF